MRRGYIALGSNLGDRRANIETALELLVLRGVSIASVSSLQETDPVDCPPGSGSFINAAAEVRTDRSPRQLLDCLLAVERELGRVRQEEAPNAPRTIDLDLLLYDELVVDEPGLVVPHPRMHQRRFVLAPLAEIAPDARHPVLGRTVASLVQELKPLRSLSVRG